MDNQKIIKKIKGLLALSKDSANDEECQSAFLLAQKLMIQYQIDRQEIEQSSEKQKEVSEREVTVFKKIYRWERQLAHLVAGNFRVKSFITTYGSKSQIIFYGLPSDLELAQEVYLFAYDSICYFSKLYVGNKISEQLTKQGKWDKRRKDTRRAFIEAIKKAYIRGYLSGLNEKFETQKSSLTNELMLLTKVPELVEKSYEERSKNFGSYGTPEKNKTFTEEELLAYVKGQKQGQKSDFTYRRVETT